MNINILLPRRTPHRRSLIEAIRRKWRKDMTFYFHWLKMNRPRAEALDEAERTFI